MGAARGITSRFSQPGYLRVVLVGVLVAQVVVTLVTTTRLWLAPFSTGDWRTYLSVVQLLKHGRGQLIYDTQTLVVTQSGLGFEQLIYYPYYPAFLLLVYPFSLLPAGPSFVAWLAFNAGLILASMWLLAREFVPRNQRGVFFLLCLTALPLWLALRIGQSSAFLLLGFSLFAVGWRRGRDWQCGLGLTLLMIKPQLLPIFGLLLLWRRRRTLLSWAAGALLLAGLSAWLVGVEGLLAYLHFLLGGARGKQYAWSHTLLGLSEVAVGGEHAYLLYGAVAMATLALSALVMRRSWGAVEQRYVLALLVLAALLVANYLLLYDLALWAVPLALAWPLAVRGRARYLLAAGYLGPWLTWLLGDSGVPFPWPTVGLMIVAWAALAGYCWRADRLGNGGAVAEGLVAGA